MIPGVILERKWGWERELKYRINIQQCWTGQSGEPLNSALNCNYSCHSVRLPRHLALSRVDRILVIEWLHGWDHRLGLSRKVSWYASWRRIQLSSRGNLSSRWVLKRLSEVGWGVGEGVAAALRVGAQVTGVRRRDGFGSSPSPRARSPKPVCA